MDLRFGQGAPAAALKRRRRDFMVRVFFREIRARLDTTYLSDEIRIGRGLHDCLQRTLLRQQRLRFPFGPGSLTPISNAASGRVQQPKVADWRYQHDITKWLFMAKRHSLHTEWPGTFRICIPSSRDSGFGMSMSTEAALAARRQRRQLRVSYERRPLCPAPPS